jgi:hypothetical protein
MGLKKTSSVQDNCVITIKREAASSLLQELRNLGLEAFDFPKAFPAKAPKPATDKPLNAGGVGPKGAAVFWASSEGTPFVDAQLFGHLTVVMVPAMAPGEQAQVGRVGPHPIQEIPQLIQQLIEADVIGTYVHLGSTLCLENIPGGLHIRGSHTYMTNTENIDALDFKVVVEPSGLILVSNS